MSAGSSLHPAGFQGTLGAGAVPLLAEPQLEGPTGTSMLPNCRIPVHAALACLTGGAIWHGQGASSSMGLLGHLSPCWTWSPVLQGWTDMEAHPSCWPRAQGREDQDLCQQANCLPVSTEQASRALALNHIRKQEYDHALGKSHCPCHVSPSGAKGK